MADLDMQDHAHKGPLDALDLKKTISERLKKSLHDTLGVKNNLRAVQEN